MQELSELVSKAQKGDRDAFGQIYNLFYQKIYKYCMYNIKSQVTAQDITQETFLKAWKSLPSFKQTKNGTIQAFLYKIAKNLIIDNSRKKKLHSIENYKNLESSGNLEETMDRQDELSKLKSAIGKLSYADRQIVVLHYLEEMPQAEIAKILGIKEGALRVRTHRAVQKLKNLLEK